VNPLILLAASYLLGATPTSYWVGRWFYGRDLRREGSGNLGATNTYRTLGWKAALPVALVDISKGYVPVAFFPALHGDAPWTWALGYGAAAIVGHVFSFWVGFRGGKGVATAAGAFVAIAPWAFLLALGTFTVVVSVSRMVSLGSLSAAVAVPVGVYLLPHRGGLEVFYFSVALALFVFWSHRENIRRILTGEENRFGSGSESGEATHG
jgi:glycerol-3-phosphate acyltransferase PlsY